MPWTGLSFQKRFKNRWKKQAPVDLELCHTSRSPTLHLTTSVEGDRDYPSTTHVLTTPKVISPQISFSKNNGTHGQCLCARADAPQLRVALSVSAPPPRARTDVKTTMYTLMTSASHKRWHSNDIGNVFEVWQNVQKMCLLSGMLVWLWWTWLTSRQLRLFSESLFYEVKLTTHLNRHQCYHIYVK